MADMNVLSFILAIIYVACQAPQVAGHGNMVKPAPRQFCILNKRGWRLAPTHQGSAEFNKKDRGGWPGPCGDPFAGAYDGKPTNYKDTPCEPQEVYKQGQVIDVEIRLVFNHGGHFEFSLCDQRNGDQACFDRRPLKTLPHNTEMWHVMTPIGSKSDIKNPDMYTVQVKLPDDVSCPEGCVLSWAWWTSHQCIYECEKEYCDWYADRKSWIPKEDQTWDSPICKTKRPKVGQNPQIYVNCADIIIEPTGKAPGGKASDDKALGGKAAVDKDPVSKKDNKKPTPSDKDPLKNLAKHNAVDEDPVKNPENKPGPSDEDPFKNLAEYYTEEKKDSSGDSSDDADEDCTCMSGRRRMLNVEKVRETDSREEKSAMGTDMNCGDFVVADVIESLSIRRVQSGSTELTCSNRATATVENHASTMCQLGRLLYDASDICRNSRFAHDRCNTLVFQTSSTETDAVVTALGDNLEYLTSWEVMEMGVGYHVCGDTVYWAIVTA